MRRYVIPVLAVLLFTMFFGSTGAVAAEDFYLVFVWPHHDYWQPIIKGAQDAGAWLDVDVHVTGSAEYTAEGVVSSIEQVIAMAPDAIITSGSAAATPEGVVDVHNEAVASGIATIIVDSDSPDSDRYCFIGADQATLGAMAADALATAVIAKNGEAEGEIAVEYIPGSANLEARVAGFEARLAEKYPGLSVVAKVNDEGQAQTGQTQLMQLIASKPDLVGIYGVHATAAIAIGAALLETGTAGDIASVSMDATPPSLALLEEGTIDALVAQNTYNFGFWAVVMAYVAVHESEILAPNEDWHTLGLAPTPPYVNPGAMIITGENVAGYIGGED